MLATPLTVSALLVCAASLGLGYVAPALWKPLAIRRLRRRAVSRRAVVLTYDDGPGPQTTEALLDLLAEFGAPATFFLSGERIADHRDLAMRLAREGHEVAGHGFHHLHAWKSLPGKLSLDMARGMGAIRSLDSTLPMAFRPPFGKLVLPTWIMVRQLGHTIAWWTDDSGDSHAALPTRSPALDLIDRGGGVALLHDLDRSEPRNQFVLDTTRELLEQARANGLEVITFRDLLTSRRS